MKRWDIIIKTPWAHLKNEDLFSIFGNADAIEAAQLEYVQAFVILDRLIRNDPTKTVGETEIAQIPNHVQQLKEIASTFENKEQEYTGMQPLSNAFRRLANQLDDIQRPSAAVALQPLRPSPNA